MAGRGPQSLPRKLKEQPRKEKQEKMAKKLERRRQAESSPEPHGLQEEAELS